MRSSKTVEKAYCPECGGSYEAGTRTCPDDGSRLYSYKLGDDEDPLVGKVLDDRFRIVGVIGEGGMGRVYRGVQLSVERPVAVKVLRSELVDREDVIQRFLREARVISGFNSPNIVNLVEFGQDPENEVFYLAMELLDGVPLSKLLAAGRIHPNLVCEVAIQVCQGLAEAHAREVIHRDLKPDNIMLVPMSDGSIQVKVLDFGIAHAVQGEQRLTSTGQVFGTAHYMAPEQATSQPVEPATDVYSLGCIVYELLTGVLPFDSPSVMSLLVSHVQKPPPPLTEKIVDDDVPDGLVAVTMQMLEKDVSDRPASVLEVRDSIEAVRAAAGYGPVRVDPTEVFERAIRRDWVRGGLPGRVGSTSDALDPSTGDSQLDTIEGFGMAETAAHPSAPPSEPPAATPSEAATKPDAAVELDPDLDEALRASAPRHMTDTLDEQPRRGWLLPVAGASLALLLVFGYVIVSESGSPPAPEPTPEVAQTEPQTTGSAAAAAASEDLEPNDGAARRSGADRAFEVRTRARLTVQDVEEAQTASAQRVDERSTDKPSSDRPSNDRPSNDRPSNDRPSNDRPSNDTTETSEETKAETTPSKDGSDPAFFHLD